jgi:cell division protease FtsH
MANDPNRKHDDKDPNKFFQQNPLLVFAIFSILAIILFRTVFSHQDGGSLGSTELSGTTSSATSNSKKSVSYFELKQMIQNKRVSYVAIGQTMIRAVSQNNGHKIVYTVKRVSPDTTLIPLLDKHQIPYSGFSENNWFTDILFGWVLPIFIFFGIWMFLASRMQRNIGGGILGMGSSKKLINAEKPQVTFDAVAGNDEAKEEVVEIVDFLKYPDRYISLGAKIPKGVLLVGPPGTGKTLIAKAVAGEADVPFFSVSGSSFIEMFVGVGASRVRDLFENAKKEAPSIIFIDEIDAIGKSRAAGGIVSGNDEREQTLNQLLAEMDGFASDSAPVIVLAATNRPEVLDSALLRPGRFDRQVLVDKPDFQGRVEILKVHIQDYVLAKDVDLEEVSRMTAGLAGADLANIVNEAALLAGRENKHEVSQKHFREAVERSIAGLEKKSRRISPKEKKIVAYHESGHALMAETTRGAKRVTKVSIIPRGLAALGYTLNTPEENKYLMQKHELIAEVDVLLGGRAAEEVFIGEISTGASNDLERATDILKAMASLYGMTDVTGLMVLEKQRNAFLNPGMPAMRDYSEKVSEQLDHYVQNTLQERYLHVLDRLRKYQNAIEGMVDTLMEKETIEGQHVREIIANYEKQNNMETQLVPDDTLDNQTDQNTQNKETQKSRG